MPSKTHVQLERVIKRKLHFRFLLQLAMDAQKDVKAKLEPIVMFCKLYTKLLLSANLKNLYSKN